MGIATPLQNWVNIEQRFLEVHHWSALRFHWKKQSTWVLPSLCLSHNDFQIANSVKPNKVVELAKVHELTSFIKECSEESTDLRPRKDYVFCKSSVTCYR